MNPLVYGRSPPRRRNERSQTVSGHSNPIVMLTSPIATAARWNGMMPRQRQARKPPTGRNTRYTKWTTTTTSASTRSNTRADGSGAGRGSGFDDDPVAHGQFAAAQHPRVGAAPTRMAIVVDAAELSVGEPLCVLRARRRERGDLDEGRADRESHSRTDGRPVDAGERDVLARRPGMDRVTFGAQRVDDLERPQTQRLQRLPVVLAIGLRVADDAAPIEGDAIARGLRHPTARHAALDERAALCRRT